MEDLAKFVYNALFVHPAPKKWTTKDLSEVMTMYASSSDQLKMRKPRRSLKFCPYVVPSLTLMRPSILRPKEPTKSAKLQQTCGRIDIGSDGGGGGGLKKPPYSHPSTSSTNYDVLQGTINDPRVFKEFTSANLLCSRNNSTISSSSSEDDDDDGSDGGVKTFEDSTNSSLEFFVKMDVQLSEMKIPVISSNELTRKGHMATGSFGTCYAVEYKKQNYVCKKFNTYQELLREVKFLHFVRNIPNVQQLVGVCMDEVELITQYAGVDLHDYYKKPVSEHKTFKIIKKMLDTVVLLNDCGIAHNDIKTTNVCVKDHADDDDFDVTLIDFGLANRLGNYVFKPFSYESKDHSKFRWLHKELLMGVEGSSIVSEGYSVMFLISELIRKNNRLVDMLKVKQ